MFSITWQIPRSTLWIMYAEVLYTTSKINHRILKIHDLDSSFYSHRSRCHDPDEERVRQRRVRREDRSSRHSKESSCRVSNLLLTRPPPMLTSSPWSLCTWKPLWIPSSLPRRCQLLMACHNLSSCLGPSILLNPSQKWSNGSNLSPPWSQWRLWLHYNLYSLFTLWRLWNPCPRCSPYSLFILWRPWPRCSSLSTPWGHCRHCHHYQRYTLCRLSRLWRQWPLCLRHIMCTLSSRMIP